MACTTTQSGNLAARTPDTRSSDGRGASSAQKPNATHLENPENAAPPGDRQAVGPSSRDNTATRERSALVGEIVRLVNAERRSAGCQPLELNALLSTAAQRHSDDMQARHFFSHTNPDGAGPAERITAAGYHWMSYAENIAFGQPDPVSVMRTWTNSTGHRDNILDCGLKDIGVGVASGQGGPWWTQDFGSRSQSGDEAARKARCFGISHRRVSPHECHGLRG
ncbi:CAP domain-containing protein [Streptomyces sp. NPDC020801]|uniref:CAP domain-containing protein n=1 Tax=Streptomyces sp. NPDC020801 TaxID=3365093 RepID=UPI0037A86615